ncbi:hypothetical protein [Cellulomonas marina]|uniref:LemA family protein n=1 Tax=Cellulomonas marina TaxID=988821 RepID=A0A1I0W5K9_9CELL|nr:hypothetical protein [Cellulomonas marina]GIG30517.1 membrane protein [Cellulomonas marina]SFA83962.1 hypothetical protein SAMN05421867_102207 [Cellulomonas marina]
MTTDVGVIVLGVGALLVWVVWVAASRLDRLHRKVGASRAVLDTQLVRRATAAAELATSGLLDPVSSVLVGEAALAALACGGTDAETEVVLPEELRALLVEAGTPPPAGPRPLRPTSGAPRLPLREERARERARAESELTNTLRTVLDEPEEVAALRAEPGGDELLDDLAAAWYRVQLARRFHNEAVAQTQRLRRGVLVRALRLAGHAPMPRTLELDDSWPAAFADPSPAAR